MKTSMRGVQLFLNINTPRYFCRELLICVILEVSWNGTIEINFIFEAMKGIKMIL